MDSPNTFDEKNYSRRRFLAQTAVAASLASTATTLTAQQAATFTKSAVERYGQLHAKGNKIVGKDDNPAVLRGASLFWSQWMGQFYNVDAIRWLRDDWHCTIVRAALGVEAGGYLQNPAQEQAKINKVVEATIELGIYVIIDWHDHNAHQHTQKSQEFFSEMAKTYGNSPNVIFETWNEPLNTHDWAKTIKPYHEAVISKIREHSKNLIVCGTQTWSQDVDKAARNPLAFDNVAYTLHFYAGTHKQGLRDKATAALNAGAALMVTEWGACDANGSGELAAKDTRLWLDFLDKNNLSWCNWSIADKDETSAALIPGAPGTGNWTSAQLSPSGKLVREELRSKA